MEIDCFTFFKAVCKIFARHKLLHREVLSETNEVDKRQLAKPFAVIAHLRLFWIKHTKRLFRVSLRVMGNLLLGQDGTRLVFIGWVAHQSSVAANEERHIMPQILELT